jgi:hypothetical protein
MYEIVERCIEECAICNDMIEKDGKLCIENIIKNHSRI